jgi:hypothetical protein
MRFVIDNGLIGFENSSRNFFGKTDFFFGDAKPKMPLLESESKNRMNEIVFQYKRHTNPGTESRMEAAVRSALKRYSKASDLPFKFHHLQKQLFHLNGVIARYSSGR